MNYDYRKQKQHKPFKKKQPNHFQNKKLVKDFQQLKKKKNLRKKSAIECVYILGL